WAQILQLLGIARLHRSRRRGTRVPRIMQRAQLVITIRSKRVLGTTTLPLLRSQRTSLKKTRYNSHVKISLRNTSLPHKKHRTPMELNKLHLGGEPHARWAETWVAHVMLRRIRKELRNRRSNPTSRSQLNLNNRHQ